MFSSSSNPRPTLQQTNLVLMGAVQEVCEHIHHGRCLAARNTSLNAISLAPDSPLAVLLMYELCRTLFSLIEDRSQFYDESTVKSETERNVALLLQNSTTTLSRMPEIAPLSSQFPAYESRNMSERVRFYQGYALFSSLRHEDAIWTFTEAIQESRTNVSAYCYRAASFSAIQRHADAILDIEAAKHILSNPQTQPQLTHWSNEWRSRLPGLRAAILTAQRFDSGEIDHDANDVSLYTEYLESDALERVGARNDGLAVWGNMAEVESEGEVRRVENWLLLLIDRLASESVRLSHRVLITNLCEKRPMVDTIVSFYYSAAMSNSSSDEEDSSPAFQSLLFSDLFKSASFVHDLKVPSSSTLRISSADLCSTSDTVVILFHLVSSSHCLYRWVVFREAIVVFDCRQLDEETMERIVFLSSSIEEESDSVSAGAMRGWLLRNMNERDPSPPRVAEAPSRPRSFLEDIRLKSERNSEVLYSLLLGGIDTYLSQSKHIVFVPDELLFRVPFASLKNEKGEYLVETHSFSISCSMWMMAKNRRRRERINLHSREGIRCVIGECHSVDPLGEESEGGEVHSSRIGFGDECNSIVETLNRRRKRKRSENDRVVVTLRNRTFNPATLETLCSESNPRILHFASHGCELDPGEVFKENESDILYEFDMKGALQCASGEPLLARTVAESFDLRMTELVYLSCCSLGDGQLNESGMLGFYRACQVAGCPSVICSLWPVFSQLSYWLATRFYKTWTKKKVSKAEALRMSMLKLMNQRFGRGRIRDHPVLWSSFQLFGHGE